MPLNYTSSLTPITDADAWGALIGFSVFRFLLAGFFFGAYYLGLPPEFLGSTHPDIFKWTSEVYAVLALLLLASSNHRWGSFEGQVKIQLLVDIVIITILIHSSGGLQTGLGALLVVTVALGGILMPGRMASFFAAVATLAIFVQAGYGHILGNEAMLHSQLGTLGAMFFATALLAQMLGGRVRATQAIADKHAVAARQLVILNQHIIDRLEIGVMVVNENGEIYSTNQAARKMLAVSETINGTALTKQVPVLAGQLAHWRAGRPGSVHEFQPKPNLAEIMPQIVNLDGGDALIFLNDMSVMTQQAQQMKLASLGQMAASIAHEVRNPLGAISHAAELLTEADNIKGGDYKLLNIIQRQSERVNGIIDTILQLSRRKQINQQTFVLAAWLEQFQDEFCQNEQIPPESILFKRAVPLAKVRMDPEQLRQVLWNLCRNAWHFSVEPGARDINPRITIRMDATDSEIYVEVVDNGPGVSESALPQLFEPFHSERTGGIGLGLYLSREMCRANGARLGYIAPAASGLGASFRITFNLATNGIA